MGGDKFRGENKKIRCGLVRLDVLYRVLREGITDTMAFEQKLEESKRSQRWVLPWRIPGQWFQSRDLGANIPEWKWERGKVTGDEGGMGKEQQVGHCRSSLQKILTWVPASGEGSCVCVGAHFSKMLGHVHLLPAYHPGALGPVHWREQSSLDSGFIA